MGIIALAAAGLLIVVPARLRPALDTYAAFKHERLPVRVATLEDILASAPGVDDAEKLKRYLFQQWSGAGAAAPPAAERPGYVLLVGDADALPVRYMVLDRNTDAAFNYAFYPSDLYYADLARPDGSFDDWNAAADGFHARYFGEVRGEHNKDGPINFDRIDYTPEVAVGRWPVSTPEQVRTVAEKTMRYERAIEAARAADGDTGHRPIAGLVAVDGWIDNRPLMDALAASLGDRWQVRKLYPGTKDPPDAAGVARLLNDGATLVLHSGHGEPNSWAGSFGVGDLASLTNADHPAIVLSAGCSTAYFAALGPYEAYIDADGHEHRGTNAGEVFTEPPPPPACYQPGAFNKTGLGERLLRDGPAGAAAYFGCNTGSQPCGMTLLAGFAEAVGSARKAPPPGSSPTRLGDAWVHAIKFYQQHEHLADLKPTDSWYPPSVFFQGMKFMLFGDPSIPVE